MTDLLDELREANPVDAASLRIPDELRSRALAGSPRRRRHGGRRPAALVLVAACAVTAILMLGGRGDTPDLLARAYAATTGPGIIHWRTEIVGSSGGRVGSHQRTEGWTRKGVTHVLRYDVIHGKGILQSDTRTANGRTTIWSRAAHDYLRLPARRSATADPFQSGDPFAIFRRAYRTGKLTKIGPSRFAIDLPGRSDDRSRPGAQTTYYDIDPDSALPTRLVVKTPARTDILGVPGTRRPASQTVMTFAVYEKLPFTSATRRKLRLLPHPSGGPKDIAAAQHYAVLRTGARPDAEGAKAVARLVRHMTVDGLDASAARTLAPRTYLLPGPAHVCLVHLVDRGSGGGCRTTEEAIKRGISILMPGTELLLVVPDGVTAVRARLRGRRYRRVEVHDNLARLPPAAFAWTFLR